MSQLIPNIYHFIFGLKEQTEPFHLVYYLCLESCLQVNSPDQIFLYYHYEPYGPYWDLIKPKLKLIKVELPAFVLNFNYQDQYVKKFSYAHLADFIRVEKLIEHGGIYADIDTIFVNPLPARLYQQSFVIGREADVPCPTTGKLKPSLCNAFLMSAAGAEFGRHWLAEMASAFDGTWSKHSCYLPQELSERYPQSLHIEPARSFYKHMWTREGIHTLLEGCDRDFENVYSFHLWNHLWWEKKRRDFSNFHAGRLTADYIRRVDTTYNIVARRFLPEQIVEPKQGLRRFLWW